MVSTSELQKTRGTVSRRPSAPPLVTNGKNTLFVWLCVQFLHKLTARAVIQDYEDGNLDADEAQHEVGKGPTSRFRKPA